jgi:hypothetical protein
MQPNHGASGPTDADEWLSADSIAALAGGRVKANTVRNWWRTGALEYVVFPELGTKSNKRSNRRAVELFLRRKLGTEVVDRERGPGAPGVPGGSQDARVVDLVDTLTSIKAAADAAMQALISEAEHHAAVMAAQAEISRAQAHADGVRAEADARRVEMLRHLQTMFRGYDLALSTHVQPSTAEGAAPAAEY